MTTELQPPPAAATPLGLTPQALLLNFLGGHVLDREAAEHGVPAAVMIEVCRRVGIGEHAVRSTLKRMVNSGLLGRRLSSRTAYYTLTERSSTVLRDAARRIWDVGAVRTERDDQGWTLLAFTMPTPARPERHRLRTRLTWAGFGPLQAGLWIAPAPADLSPLLGDPDFAPYLKVFDAVPWSMTDMRTLSCGIWDLDALAERYRGFIDRWTGRMTGGLAAGDPLGRQLLLSFEWLDLLGTDPRLPASCLPADWPAAAAERVFRDAGQLLARPAADVAEYLLASS